MGTFVSMKTTKLKKYLRNNGIKQSWLAGKLGISQAYLSQILSEDRGKPGWFDYKLGDVLKINTKE